MFSFFKVNPKNTSLDWIGTDMHSHLLPGLDDGSPDLESSIRYVKKLHQLGFQKLICTPHIFKEVYPNDKATISAARELLSGELKKAGISVELEAAAEYMINPDFDPLLKRKELLCLPADHVLIEMSYQVETKNIEQYLFDLNISGYTPVLAHPERYNYYHKDFDRYRRLKDFGCILQLNLLSLTNYYGRGVRDIALRLIKSELIDLVGTDLHHQKHLWELEHFAQSGKAWQHLGKYPLKNGELFSQSSTIFS
jgi:tyrosine-protein phosphatase YwqE